MMKIKMLMLIMMSIAIITGCSKIEEVKNKIDVRSERKFKTIDEGQKKLLPALKEKYSKDFKVEKFSEYIDEVWNIKRVQAVLKTTDTTECIFSASLENNGKLRDSYVACHYENEIKHMFDATLANITYLDSFEVEFTSNGIEEVYDTTKSYETYLKENYGFIYLDIHMNDRPTNEQMVERVRYLLPLVASENYQIMPSFKINDRYVYSTQINREKVVPEKMLDEGIILDALRRDDYNNGKFTDEE